MLAAIFGIIHSLFAACAPGDNTCLANSVHDTIAKPLLDAMKFVIPGAVAVAGLHKVMEHRESGGAFLVEMLTKGGGAFLLIQLVETLFNI